MTLNEVMKETADAIREKTGKSELIAPVNFAEEIKGISAGGGESGGSDLVYYKFLETAPTMARKNVAGSYGSLAKGTFTNMQGDEFRDIFPPGIGIAGFQIGVIEAVEINKGRWGFDETNFNALLATGWLVEITKEQFYALE